MGQSYQERMTRTLLVLAVVLGGCGVDVETRTMTTNEAAARALHAGADIGYRACKQGVPEEEVHKLIERSTAER